MNSDFVILIPVFMFGVSMIAVHLPAYRRDEQVPEPQHPLAADEGVSSRRLNVVCGVVLTFVSGALLLYLLLEDGGVI